MHLIDINGREAVHLVSNLEPKWKPMAEFGKDGLLHELSSVAEAFLAIPAIDPEDLRPKGCWEQRTTQHYIGPDKHGRPKYKSCHYYTCDHCFTDNGVKTKFCPNCGARMEVK